MRARRAETGFTLVELMIVMVVLAILAGIVMFKVGAFGDEASAAACRADVRALDTANVAYVVRHGGDAPDVDALVSGGYLASAPQSGVTFADGHTTPASPDGCSSGLSASPTTSPTTTSSTSSSSTTSSSLPATVALASASGSTLRSGSTDSWTATITVSVVDGLGAAVGGAQVAGSWGDGASGSGCATGGGGSCSFTSSHSTGSPSTKVTWTLSSVTKAGATAGSNAVTTVECKRSGAPNGGMTCTVA